MIRTRPQIGRAAELLTDGRTQRVLLPENDHEDRIALTRGLAETLGDAAVPIDLLTSDDADGPICGVLEAAARFDEPVTRRALGCDWGSMAQAVDRLGEALSERQRALVIHVPPNWLRDDDGDDAPEAKVWRVRLTRRRRALLRRLAALPVPIAWIASRSAPPETLGWDARRDEIVRPEKSEPWCATAAWLDRLLSSAGEASMPELAAQPRTTQINVLTRRLRARLRESGQTQYRRALQQWSRLRRPCPRADVLDLVDWPTPWRDAIAESGEDSEYLQIDPLILESLTHPLPRLERAEAVGFHARAAQYYQRLDGQSAFAETEGEEGVWWLEKVHHLAHGGPATRDAWAEQALVCREQYWSRARHLSVVEQDYAAAAAIYRQCVDRFDDDDYGWHYLGYNLQHAGGAAAEVEHAYRQAVARDEANPWWNSRLVNFLIGRGRPAEARMAWSRAGEHLDGSERWVAENAHRWVCRTWLMLGDLDDARAVLDEVADEIIERSPTLESLRHDVLDAEEYRMLGEHAVYPLTTPHDERWVRPRTEAKGCSRWFPGQVLVTDDDGVTVVYGVPNDPPDRRRAIIARFTAAQWQGMASSGHTFAPGDFIELLQFDDDRHAVHFVGRGPDEPEGDARRVHRMLNAGRRVELQAG